MWFAAKRRQRNINSDNTVNNSNNNSKANGRWKEGPHVRAEHPLNLSISLSGGRDTNKDSRSNCE